MQTRFFIHMIPPTVTAQEHSVAVVHGKPRFYDPPELADARQKLESYLGAFSPEAPFEGALRLCVKWCFPRGRHANGTYKVTRPDTDNLNKLLKDCMTRKRFWHDDAQVASEIIEKFWADIPGIWISVEQIGETQ